MSPVRLLPMIPEEKIEAVEHALRQSFRTTAVEHAELLAGGLSSALVYKVLVAGRPYLLRIVTHVDALNDPVRQYRCMNLAAEAGIAPRVYFSSAPDALAITDFVEAKPLRAHFASRDDLLRTLVGTIQAIQALPPFGPLVDFLDGVDLFIARFKSSGLLPESATREHFEHYARIGEVYPRHQPDLVSSHNDLNPNNLLFDGERLWVVDWETAFRNDPYVDLAVVAKSFVESEAQEELYLRAYFGASLDDARRARFFLMQQVCHVYYAMGMMHLAAQGRSPSAGYSQSMDAPSLGELPALIAAGHLSLDSFEGQLSYAKALLNEALHQMKTPRMERSISLVGQG